MVKLVDFEKIECPFVRVEIDGAYIVTNKVAEGYEWVFEDPSVICVEKLHGTCCAVVIEHGVVTALFNRTNRIPFIGGPMSKRFVQGVNNAVDKGRIIMQDGIHWGELIGPGIQKNEYKLLENEWVPFDWLRDPKHNTTYKSWGKYPKTFDAISEWFKTLMPLYSLREHGKEVMTTGFCEGVVFTHKDGRMAKLRRDMYPWFEGKRHKEQEEK